MAPSTFKPSETCVRFAPFRHPVHFVYPDPLDRWQELLTTCEKKTADDLAEKIYTAKECWIIQSYLRLKEFGIDVSLSKEYKSSAINVISNYDLKIKDAPANFFIVACQSGGSRPEICRHRIVQNKLNVKSAHDHFIHHWAQPGLVPRDANRKTSISNLSFKGKLYNLHESFRSMNFVEKLKSLGISFDFNEHSDAGAWLDYKNCDIVLAARNATVKDTEVKPASKLINAWRAGCPAFLGPEPAFRDLRQSELDYFEVYKPEDVIKGIQLLKDNPKLFEAMVANGNRRGAGFDPICTVSRWHELLNGPIAEDFQIWKTQFGAFQKPVRWATFFGKVFEHKLELIIYRYHMNFGKRTLNR